jgi:hypothetical protein
LLSTTASNAGGVRLVELRALDPNAGHNEKDAAAREARLKKVLAETYKGEEIPEDPWRLPTRRDGFASRLTPIPYCALVRG